MGSGHAGPLVGFGPPAPEQSQKRLVFSAASLWEVTGYAELPITGQHAVSVDTLPPLHRDPFDRLLVSQALCEGITLLTTDAQLARYPGPVRKV